MVLVVQALPELHQANLESLDGSSFRRCESQADPLGSKDRLDAGVNSYVISIDHQEQTAAAFRDALCYCCDDRK